MGGYSVGTLTCRSERTACTPPCYRGRLDCSSIVALCPPTAYIHTYLHFIYTLHIARYRCIHTYIHTLVHSRILAVAGSRALAPDAMYVPQWLMAMQINSVECPNSFNVSKSSTYIHIFQCIHPMHTYMHTYIHTWPYGMVGELAL